MTSTLAASRAPAPSRASRSVCRLAYSRGSCLDDRVGLAPKSGAGTRPAPDPGTAEAPGQMTWGLSGSFLRDNLPVAARPFESALRPKWRRLCRSKPAIGCDADRVRGRPQRRLRDHRRDPGALRFTSQRARRLPVTSGRKLEVVTSGRKLEVSSAGNLRPQTHQRKPSPLRVTSSAKGTWTSTRATSAGTMAS